MDTIEELEQTAAEVAETLAPDLWSKITEWLSTTMANGTFMEILGICVLIIGVIGKVYPYLVKLFPQLTSITDTLKELKAGWDTVVEKIENKVGVTIEEKNAETVARLQTEDAKLALIMKALLVITEGSKANPEAKMQVIEIAEEFQKLVADPTRTDYVAAKTDDELNKEIDKKAEIQAEAQAELEAEEQKINIVDALK